MRVHHLQVVKLSKSYADRVILDAVTFDVASGQHVAVVGPNGSGKSTLLKLLVGELSADGGQILFTSSSKPRIGYLPQYPEAVAGDESTWDYALRAFSERREIEQRLRQLEAQLEHGSAGATRPGESTGRPVPPDLDELLDEYGALQERFSELGGYDHEPRLRASLRQVGLSDELLRRPMATLSGGEKTRVGLAQLLARDCDFLLLDEPTNHLDVDTLEWLEDFLGKYRGTVLVVSHDRHFLDVVADRVLELRRGSISTYPGNYTAYREQTDAEERRQWQEWEQSEKRRRAIEEAIRRQAEWAQSAHEAAGQNDFWRRRARKVALRARAHLSRLQRLLDDQPSKPVVDATMEFTFPSPRRTGRRVVEASNMGLDFGSRTVFKDLGFTILNGDNVAIIGPNGSGKTSLLRLIAGELQPTSGTVWVTATARMGYLRQELADTHPHEQVVDELRSVASLTVREARNLLARVLLRGDDVFRPLQTLSQGERVRLGLAKLLARGADVLLLDEVTNHLDLDSRETVEEALSLFEGTVILVSHDRYLLDRFADRIITLYPGDARMHELTYSEYAERRRLKRWVNEHGDDLEWAGLQELYAEALRLQNRLATLGAELGRADTDDQERAQVELEYLAVSQRLAELRKQLPDRV